MHSGWGYRIQESELRRTGTKPGLFTTICIITSYHNDFMIFIIFATSSFLGITKQGCEIYPESFRDALSPKWFINVPNTLGTILTPFPGRFAHT